MTACAKPEEKCLSHHRANFSHGKFAEAYHLSLPVAVAFFVSAPEIGHHHE
jgi:hypothetical protein